MLAYPPHTKVAGLWSAEVSALGLKHFTSASGVAEKSNAVPAGLLWKRTQGNQTKFESMFPGVLDLKARSNPERQKKRQRTYRFLDSSGSMGAPKRSAVCSPPRWPAANIEESPVKWDHPPLINQRLFILGQLWVGPVMNGYRPSHPQILPHLIGQKAIADQIDLEKKRAFWLGPVEKAVGAPRPQWASMNAL